MEEDNNVEKEAATGEVEAETTPLAIAEDTEVEVRPESSEPENSSGAWKNQKQKSKKAKKVD